MLGYMRVFITHRIGLLHDLLVILKLKPLRGILSPQFCCGEGSSSLGKDVYRCHGVN